MRDISPGLRNGHDVVASFAALKPDSEAALAAFDAAVATADPDDALLSGTPATTLMEAMKAVVMALQHVDPERIARKRSWFHRFTGADLEARLQFEVSIKVIGDEMRDLGAAAQHAAGTVHLLEREIDKLEAAGTNNTALILAVRNLLSRQSSGDTARLERRLGNLEALQASQQLARAQMKLSIGHLKDLLDRFRDIEQLLFPVWQQHALAIAQSAAGVRRDLDERVSALETAQSSLSHALRRNKEAA